MQVLMRCNETWFWLHFLCTVFQNWAEWSLFITKCTYLEKERKRRCFASSEFTRCGPRSLGMLQILYWLDCEQFSENSFHWFRKLEIGMKNENFGFSKNFNYFMPFELAYTHMLREFRFEFLLCNTMGWSRIRLKCAGSIWCESDSNCFNCSNVDNFFVDSYTHRESEWRKAVAAHLKVCITVVSFFFVVLYDIAYTQFQNMWKKTEEEKKQTDWASVKFACWFGYSAFSCRSICIYTDVEQAIWFVFGPTESNGPHVEWRNKRQHCSTINMNNDQQSIIINQH